MARDASWSMIKFFTDSLLFVILLVLETLIPSSIDNMNKSISPDEKNSAGDIDLVLSILNAFNQSSR